MANISSSHEKTRSEVAAYLREFADELETGLGGSASHGEPGTTDRKVTLVTGNESATINPPETLNFDVEVDTEAGLLEAGNDHSATFRLSWDSEHVEADDDLSIE